MKNKKGCCLECGGKLKIKRTWKNIYLICMDCSTRYPEDKYKDLMDDYYEEQLAYVPVNML